MNGALGTTTHGQTSSTCEAERRRERRIPCDKPGLLQVLKPFSPEIFPTEIVEVSKGGLKLRVLEYVNRGTIVQVQFKTTIVIGEVRHCTETDSGFHIGVKLGEVTEN